MITFICFGYVLRRRELEPIQVARGPAGLGGKDGRPPSRRAPLHNTSAVLFTVLRE